jgi:hypothetical protein
MPSARWSTRRTSEEVLADERTEALKRSLSTGQPYYLTPQSL